MTRNISYKLYFIPSSFNSTGVGSRTPSWMPKFPYGIPYGMLKSHIKWYSIYFHREEIIAFHTVHFNTQYSWYVKESAAREPEHRLLKC